jgi:hypothetical protein
MVALSPITKLSREGWLALSLIFVLSILLRIWAVGGDLWIDEVWSLNQIDLARSSENTKDWLALFFHSNTHALNSLYLAVVGPGETNFLYRLLSLTSGIASVVVAVWIGARQSVATAVIAAILFGLCYPLINYSGEARGYGPMLLCALLCYVFLEKYLTDRAISDLAGFVFLSVVGVMAHLTFGVVLAGMGFWAAARIYSEQDNVIKVMARLVPLFGAQLIYLTAFGAIALNNMVRGGDCCPEPAVPSLRIMTYWTFGIDADQVKSVIPLIMLAAIVLVMVYRQFKMNMTVWVFYTVVIFLFPLIVIAVETDPQVIHRYFLPTTLFGLLIITLGLGEAWDSGGKMKAISVFLVAGFIVGQSWLLTNFGNGGRGQYGKVVDTITSSSSGPQRISGYPTFSVGSVFEYQTKYLKVDERLEFVPTKSEAPIPADWFINGYLYGKPAVPVIQRKIEGRSSVSYRLVGFFPQWGLSGDSWALYQRED